MTFQLTRRALLQGAGITLAGSVCPLTAVASGVKKAIDAMPDMYWGACVVNCGNRCAPPCLYEERPGDPDRDR